MYVLDTPLKCVLCIEEYRFLCSLLTHFWFDKSYFTMELDAGIVSCVRIRRERN